MARANATPAIQALDAFHIDGYTPFMDGPCSAEVLLTQAHGITKVLAAAFVDSGALEAKCKAGEESELAMLNTGFIASALNGVGSLVALALFLQEQRA